jgi:uncharacterized protein YdbL (DUF1318 family)
MIRLPLKLLVAAYAFTAACVTINVYFPAAAAEEAADRIIEDVWGPAAGAAEEAEQRKSELGAADDAETGRVLLAALNVLDVLVPPAHAQSSPDFDIDTPEIRAITKRMNQRFRQLQPYFRSGAVGLTGDGLVELRDRNAVPLAERNQARQLVDAENADRNALYKAIAAANGHPEWEADIRRTFAERWVARAESGWYYRTGGGWQQK